MVKRTELREDVLEALWDQFCKVIKYQRVRNQITVTMTFDEYLSLWSKYRVATIQKRFDVSLKAGASYFTGPFRPVCSWREREDRVLGALMTVDVAKIRSADDSRKLFRFHSGDRHTTEARARIGDAKRGKKQTEHQIALRTKARVATMAEKRAAREQGDG